MGKLDSWVGHWQHRAPTFKAECAQALASYLERLDKRKRQVTAACDSSPGIASLELRLI